MNVLTKCGDAEERKDEERGGEREVKSESTASRLTKAADNTPSMLIAAAPQKVLGLQEL